MIRILLIIALLTISLNSFCQTKKLVAKPSAIRETPKVNIKMQARFRGDSIVLRWGCNSAFAWRKLNSIGYVIERLELREGNKPEQSFVKLNPSPILPWTEQEWSKSSGTDANAQVASKAIYGKTFSVGTPLGKSPKKPDNTIQTLDAAAEEEAQRFAMAMMSASFSTKAAIGLGLRYVDKRIHKNSKYIYRVYAAASAPIFQTDTALFIIETKKELPLAPVQEVATYEGDRIISLRWRDVERYVGFYIERSADGKNFTRLNENPYVQFSSAQNTDNAFTYNDSIPTNYKYYYYRVKGISIFSEISESSVVVRAKGRDRTPPGQPFIYKAEYDGTRSAVLEWSPYVVTPDVKGFLVSRAQDVKGPFEPMHQTLLPPSTVRYTDSKVDVGGLNYYMVTVVDTAGNVVSSLPRYVVTPDDVPPVQPVGLTGRINDKGVVTLSWKPGKEGDIEGYRIYRANAKDHTFNPMSSTIMDTIFMDTVTLQTLTKHIYYKIVAVDRNKNNSVYSQTLELKRPDKIPPSTPAFNDFTSGEKWVDMRWAISSSKDVVKQVLNRRRKGEDWHVLTQLSAEISAYRDTLVSRNTWYEYALEAVDDSGLRSEKSFPLNVKVYDSGVRPGVKDVMVRKSDNGKSVVLTWKYISNVQCHVVIYRAVNNAPLEMYQSAAIAEMSFIDLNIHNGKYQYAIKVMYDDGGESELSKTASIEIGM